MSAVKVSDLFKQSDNWYNFFVEFHNYKLCGDQPDIFGRDERLDLDNMWHIHLAGTERMQAIWRKQPEPFYRTTKIDDPDNDFWLLYAYEPFRDEYLLLTILGPDAHNRKEWSGYLGKIHQEIVRPWVEGRIVYTDPDEDE